MTRWSLRRHRHRAQQPVAGTVRLDPLRPELEPASASGYRPDGYAPDTYAPGGRHSSGGYAPDGYASEAYAPRPSAGFPMAQPGGAQPGFPEPGFGQPGMGEPFAAEQRSARAATGALPSAGGPWPDVMDQFGLHLLTLAEQLRIALDELENDEADPERLQKLYRVDHAVTRMRRASRDLRTLAGRADEELSGIDTSLLDVIRMALSSIERYTQVTIGKVADFGVLGYAADDVASLLAALLDNATRYSPRVALISAHLTESGSVLFRIEDSGIGMDPDGVAALNAMLAGDVPELDDRTGRHTGFPVVHRLARKHSIGVRLAARPAPGSGTLALVTVPPELMCEMPDEAPDRLTPPPPSHAREGSVSVLRTARREPPTPPSGTSYGSASAPSGVSAPAGSAPSDEPAGDTAASPADNRTPAGLPRRERTSLRGGKPRPGAGSGSGDAEQAPERSAEQLSAARRAFADDLTAFSFGSQDPAAPGNQDPGKGTPS